MRSITYMLKGTPCCLDDCLDYSQKVHCPDSITIELNTQEGFYEDYTLVYMRGRHCWSFPAFTVSFESEYGAFLIEDTVAAVTRKMAMANNGFRSELTRIQLQGCVPVIDRYAFTYERDAYPYYHKQEKNCV